MDVGNVDVGREPWLASVRALAPRRSKNLSLLERFAHVSCLRTRMVCSKSVHGVMPSVRGAPEWCDVPCCGSAGCGLLLGRWRHNRLDSVHNAVGQAVDPSNRQSKQWSKTRWAGTGSELHRVGGDSGDRVPWHIRCGLPTPQTRSPSRRTFYLVLHVLPYSALSLRRERPPSLVPDACATTRSSWHTASPTPASADSNPITLKFHARTLYACRHPSSVCLSHLRRPYSLEPPSFCSCGAIRHAQLALTASQLSRLSTQPLAPSDPPPCASAHRNGPAVDRLL
jgi:hypothetical protein